MKAIAPSSPVWAKAAALLGPALLAACAAPPRPVPVPAPAPTPAPLPPPPPLPRPPADWRDAAQTAGTWRWAIVQGRSTASFVGTDGSAKAGLSCDKLNGRVLLSRAGSQAVATPMALTSTFGTRPLSSDPLRSPPGWIVAELHASDPMLDSIAFSRGRFAFEVAGMETLYLPSWPEIGRVIEDCR
ncbi:hypothetical protein [Novosphingobium sp.]|uniref:hypothetical protein n=1 Tax=Novosphingobium sp. TaxID=1874826 RepID=UPI0025FBB580|nr:hypothetical protein [Novosphingobium sp.]MCC6924894.1 hypothetical protein [Novosphingobium sp.]